VTEYRIQHTAASSAANSGGFPLMGTWAFEHYVFGYAPGGYADAGGRAKRRLIVVGRPAGAGLIWKKSTGPRRARQKTSLLVTICGTCASEFNSLCDLHLLPF
jgi:hypothetical protein